MKWCLLTALAGLAFSSAAAERAPRNPFWATGYEGMRHPITVEPRFRLQAAGSSGGALSAATRAPTEYARRTSMSTAERLAEDFSGGLWSRASKTLRFGSTMFLEDVTNGQIRASIIINDRAYGLGDLVSTDFQGYRFTWKVESLSTDGKLKLNRLTHRSLRKNK